MHSLARPGLWGLSASDVMLCHDSACSHWSQHSHWQNIIGQTYVSVMLVLTPMTLKTSYDNEVKKDYLLFSLSKHKSCCMFVVMCSTYGNIILILRTQTQIILFALWDILISNFSLPLAARWDAGQDKSAQPGFGSKAKILNSNLLWNGSNLKFSTLAGLGQSVGAD